MSDRNGGILQRLWSSCVEIASKERHRGQIEPRTIMGVIVLLIIAGPLAAADVDIAVSLASTPILSWFSAVVITLLIVAAIVAAALGWE